MASPVFTVTGCRHTWNASTKKLTLYQPTSNVHVHIVAEKDKLKPVDLDIEMAASAHRDEFSGYIDVHINKGEKSKLHLSCLGESNYGQTYINGVSIDSYYPKRGVFYVYYDGKQVASWSVELTYSGASKMENVSYVFPKYHYKGHIDYSISNVHYDTDKGETLGMCRMDIRIDSVTPSSPHLDLMWMEDGGGMYSGMPCIDVGEQDYCSIYLWNARVDVPDGDKIICHMIDNATQKLIHEFSWNFGGEGPGRPREEFEFDYIP